MLTVTRITQCFHILIFLITHNFTRFLSLRFATAFFWLNKITAREVIALMNYQILKSNIKRL